VNGSVSAMSKRGRCVEDWAKSGSEGKITDAASAARKSRLIIVRQPPGGLATFPRRSVAKQTKKRENRKDGPSIALLTLKYAAIKG